MGETYNEVFNALHEVAHKAEGTQAYLDMVDEVQKIVADENAPADVKALVGDRVQRRKELIKSYWDKDLSREQNRYVVDTELISNMLGDLLGNSNFVERMAKRQSSAWERFVMAMKAADAGKAAGISKESQKYLSGLYKAYVKAVDDAESGVKVSSIVDKEEKEEDVDDSRHSFVGKNARTANHSLLNRAQALERLGVDSETIRKETGWFKGYDGKWRFEIDDFESALIETPSLQKHEDDGEVYFTGKLSDIFSHSVLFEAYPALQDINVVIQETDFGVDAIYQPNSNYITLSCEHFKRYTKEYRNYLNGGRVAEIERIEQTPEYQEYNRWYDDDIADTMEPTAWLEAEFKARQKFFSSELGKRYYQLKYSKNDFSGEKFELGWGEGAKEVLLHELQHAVQKIEGFATGTSTRDKNYDRNAGEIEAFDTGRRANLTAEQRKNTRPDIDRESVVIASADVSYYANDEGDSVREQLELFADELNNMNIVASATETITFKNTNEKKAYVEKMVKKNGSEVDRQGYGIVVIDSDRLKNGIRYIKKSDSASVIAYSFVPKIIKRGIVIGGHPNHKERGYPTVTFAAPVEINGVRGNMAVVVRQEGKNYYKMHKLRMPDGSLFIYDNAERNSADRAGHSFYAKETLSPTDTVSIKSIPQNSEKSTENEKKVSDKRSSKKKVYKRAEASAVLEEAVSEHLVFSDAYAKLKGQSKREAASMLWKALNTAEGDEAQKRAALNVADYVLDHAVVAAFEGNAYTDAQAKTVAALKPYLHKLDLDGIKGEIRNRFGKDTSPYLLWGKHKDSVGVAPDAIVSELAELGVIIDAKNPADIFFEIYDTYKKAKDGLEASAASLLKHALSAEERSELREQISSDILRAYEEKGVETLNFNQFYKELEKAQRSAEVWKAAQKYMIMGYLGYKNTLGKEQVQAYIRTLELSAEQKKELLEASGY